MRLLIAGGGTGGHLFPGVAIVEELRARDPSAEVLFVGTARGIEAEVVPRLGYPLRLIDASGLKTVGRLGALRGLIRVPRALWQSRRILREFRPDAVIGVGGYASGPVVLAAWLRRIPTAILEQNSIPGLANKLLGRLVPRVFLAFDETRRFFKEEQIRLSGNPIRRAIRAGLQSAARAPDPEHDRFRVLCFGGSLGARAVNQIVVEAMKQLGDRVALVHQTGKDDAGPIAAAYRDAGLTVDVRAFIEDMAAEYGRADLVIARAGATTIAELTTVGRPAILIPYPFAADNHQERNAQALADAGAALVFRQSELDGVKLAAAVKDLADDPGRLERMQSAMKSLGRPEAAETIVAWATSQRKS
jgi:UDP-N-acetylglucosamine--N-acetylmuramyl-(pentapeptide) pyrophosphoryl-undecaprenol N-acetylglucosamine transferase